MPEGHLTIKPVFDMSDSERAINELKKKLSSVQSEINGNNAEIERLTKKQTELNEKKAQGGEAEQKTKDHLDGISKRLDDLKQKQSRLVELEKEYNAQLERAQNTANISVAPEMNFQSINAQLNKWKEQIDFLKTKESELTAEIENQKEAAAGLIAKVEEWKSIGFTKDTSSTTASVFEEAEQAEANIKKLNVELDKVRANIDDILEKYYRLSNTPMEFDAERIKQAKEESKQLDAVLKNIQGTASEITFPKLSLDVDDSKLQSLIAKYNQLAAQYETQSSKVAKLRAQVQELHRIEAEQRAGGAVSPEVISRLGEYESKLREAESQLDALGVKTQSARNAVIDYENELDRSASVGYRAFDRVKSAASRVADGFEKVVTRIKNMIFRFVVMRTLYAAFDALKNIMSAVNSQSDSMSNKFNLLKSNLLVAFYPVIELLQKGLERLVTWLIQATQWVGAFIHALTGADINNSVEKAKELYDAMNAEANAKADKANIDAKIKAKQREIKELEKQAKAVKKEYEAEKKAIEKKKDALDDEIDAVNKTIKALRRQESAEKKAAKALKESIQEQIDALNGKKKSRKDELDAERKATDAQIKAIEKQIKALEKEKELREEALKGEEKSLAGFDTLQILSGTEDVDPEVEAIEKQIEALEEKKDALNEVKDAIPSDSDDPLIQQIEAQIDALEKQKDAIKEVDYSSLIEQQQDIIEGYRDQKDALDKLLQKLQEKYDFKIDGIDEAKQKIQDAITELQEAKAAIEDARNEASKPQKFAADTSGIDDANKKIEESGTKWGEFVYKTKRLFEIGLQEIANYGKGVASQFKSASDNMLFALIAMFEGVGENLRQAVEDIGGFLDDVIGIFYSLITGNFKNVWIYLQRAGAHLVNFFIDILNMFINVVEGVVKVALSILAAFLSPISGFIESIADRIGWGNFDKSKWNPANWTSWQWNDIPHIPVPEIPALARGAVLPGGKPFLAMLGDQPAGQTNVETPLETIKQALIEAMAEQGTTNVTITFNGTLGQLARVLEPEIEVAKKRSSAFA